MKKIRRIRIRTKTSRLLVIENQTAPGTEDSRICPTCGQELPLETGQPLKIDCEDTHEDQKKQNISGRNKKEFFEKYEKE
jgi:DNA repair exonuclease SbcCD ATPase subunit